MRKTILHFLQTEKRHAGEDLKLLLLLLAAACLLHVTGIGCPIRFFTGIPCAGCGMCRALLGLSRGNVPEAVSYHPLSLIMPAAFAVWFFRGRLSVRTRSRLLVLAVLLFGFTYFFRILHGDPVLTIDPAGGFLLHSLTVIAKLVCALRA